MSGVVPRSRVRRAGIIYLTLLATGTLGALLVAPRLDDPATVLAALLPTWAGAYLAWSAYRAERTEAAAGQTPEVVADRLAGAVRHAWEGEAEVRRLAEPYPLPVGWRAADRDLADAPGPPAGRGGEIADVFTEGVPARRLLVLGDPGSGKTLLLVRLVLALIERRRPGEPVPVLFPLASWDPTALDLRDWMERRLVRDHADLGASAPEPYGQVTLARMLLDRRLILPVLDGFDEIPAAAGAAALHRIGQALPYGRAMVLSSRPAEYRAALRPRASVPPRLAGLVGIHLVPLDRADVAAYLLSDAGGPGTPAARRWAPVVRALRTDTPVARALTGPLMVSLARSVYNPRPDEGYEVLPDPAGVVWLRDRAAVEHHLLDAFVDAAYRPHPRRPIRWPAQRARPALRFLARHMERGLDGAAEVAWWQLRHAVPDVLPKILAGVLLGVVAWLFEGSVMELSHRFTPGAVPPEWEQRGGLGIVAAGICGGLVCGLAAGAAITVLCVLVAAPDVTAALVLNRLADSGALALVGMIIAGFAFGARPRLRRPSAWDRRALLTGALAALCYVAAFGNVCGVAGALLYGVTAAVIGADGVLADPARPVTGLRWHWSAGGVGRALLVGTLLGGSIVLEGLVAHAVLGPSGEEYIASPELPEAFGSGVQLAAVFTVSCLLVHGLRTVPVDLGGCTDERALLANDRRTLGTCVLTAAVIGAAVIGAQGWCAVLWGSTRVWGAEATGGHLWMFTVGLIPALLTGLAVGMRQAAWGHYAVARCCLALRLKVPYDLMGFLADAHDRGVLRRVGAVYQFRHIELQHRLAANESSAGR
ncbi:NACHT domain-containing protein [Streptomyces sp. YU58]|uniref:NACHT domain-containing protein n=1 Tax=Streptomyces sp. SX92 TaxID=3158972 RepID=UPI0027B8F8D8|nr:NACHT domain-containing protein [Streptomyces coralus]WLW56280.1 NACHT domain-containing protein [Streptomyces coralus]